MSLFPFCQWRNGGSGSSWNLPEVTRVERGRRGFKPTPVHLSLHLTASLHRGTNLPLSHGAGGPGSPPHTCLRQTHESLALSTENHTQKAEEIPCVLDQRLILTGPQSLLTGGWLFPFPLRIPERVLFIHSHSAGLWSVRASPSVPPTPELCGPLCSALSRAPDTSEGLAAYTQAVGSPGLLATGLASPRHPLSSSSSEFQEHS